jgi:hypothetical protein
LTLPLYHPVFPATVDDAINDLWKFTDPQAEKINHMH